MTSPATPTPKPTYILRGDRITSLPALYREFAEAINAPSGYFGGNLDAFRDCLSGGFGTPDHGFTIEWRDSEISRRALSHPHHPGGPSEFAILMDIFDEAREWGIELILK